MVEKPRRWLLTIPVIALIPAAGYWLLNRGYGETSERGYQYAVALYSACNQEDDTRLRRISEMVAASLDAGELRPAEAKWLSAIINKGLAGSWEAASRDVRRLMEDQLEPAAAPAE